MNDIVGARRGADDAGVLVDSLEELADDEGYGLDALDLLLGANELALKIELLVFDVAFLNGEELQVSGEFLVLGELMYLDNVDHVSAGVKDLKSGVQENRSCCYSEIGQRYAMKNAC